MQVSAQVGTVSKFTRTPLTSNQVCKPYDDLALLLSSSYRQDWKSITSPDVCLLFLPVAIYKWTKESLAVFCTYIYIFFAFQGSHISEIPDIITIQLTSIFINYLLISMIATFSNGHSNFLASSYYLSHTSLHVRACELETEEGKEREGKKEREGGKKKVAGKWGVTIKVEMELQNYRHSSQ